MAEGSVVSSSPAVVDGRLYIGSYRANFPVDISTLYVFELPQAGVRARPRSRS